MNGQFLTDLFDSLTPPASREDHGLRGQAHALIGFSIVSWLVGTPIGVAFALLGHRGLGLAIGLAIAAGTGAVLLMRRLNGRMRASQWLASGSLFGTIAYGLVTLGGDVTTVNCGWVAVVPVMATYLGSIRLGAFWLAMGLCLVVALAIATALGHPFPINPVTDTRLAYTISAVCLIVFTGALAVAIQGSRYRLQRELHDQARRDALTGLANRRRFHEGLEEAILRGQRGHPVALIYLDLDRFKAINDTLGHHAGDQVLKEFAERLRASVRSFELVARLGGDEFAIVLEDLQHASVPTLVAQRILEAMRKPFSLDAGSLVVTTSIGIAPHHRADIDTHRLHARADLALYRAKSGGRNRYCVVDSLDP